MHGTSGCEGLVDLSPGAVCTDQTALRPRTMSTCRVCVAPGHGSAPGRVPGRPVPRTGLVGRGAKLHGTGVLGCVRPALRGPGVRRRLHATRQPLLPEWDICGLRGQLSGRLGKSRQPPTASTTTACSVSIHRPLNRHRRRRKSWTSSCGPTSRRPGCRRHLLSVVDLQ